MARWEPNAPERLVLAALDLFAEQGYDNTTVIQIAQRAGLTKTTFFRHFPDKREVLFAGQDVHSRLLADGAAAAPDAATPLEAVAAALDNLCASFAPEQKEFGPRLLAVIAASPELRERSTFKNAALASSLAEALGKRGVPDLTASLAAELGVHAFHRAFAQWVEPSCRQPLADLTRQALADLRAAAAALA